MESNNTQTVFITEQKGNNLILVASDLVPKVSRQNCYMCYRPSSPGQLGAVGILGSAPGGWFYATAENLARLDNNQRFNVIRAAIRTIPILPQ